MSENSITEQFNPLAIEADDPSVQEYLMTNIRNDIREIIRSYHQTYDHLVEALQNAVDACESAFVAYRKGLVEGSYAPAITVVLDLSRNCMKIVDNGMGMSKDHLMKYFFVPHATLKRQGTLSPARCRGEKGVGAAFLSFGSAWIEISTKTAVGSASSCRLEGGIHWAIGADEAEPPFAVPVDADPILNELPHGTAVAIGFNPGTNIKELRRHGSTTRDWENIIRLYTAVGYVLPFGERDEFLDALTLNLVVIKNGVAEQLAVRTGFLLPHQIDGVTSEQVSKLRRGHEGRLPRKQTKKDCIWDSYPLARISQELPDTLSEELRDALERYEPAAYLAFVWSREFWDVANSSCFRTRRKELAPGLVFSTRTQRIGELREISFRWRSGDYNRFFMLLDVHNLYADIGRKSVPRELRDLGNEIANALQEEFVRNADALKREPSRMTENLALRLEELTDAVLAYPELDEARRLGLQLAKVPQEEQDVVALFFNLLGAGHLRGYTVLATKASATYDGFATFRLSKDESTVYHPARNPLGLPADKFGDDGMRRSPERSVIEFKLSTDGLVRDVKHEDKRLADIRWLVCWDIGNQHEREDMEIIDVTTEEQRAHREYYGVTHVLTDSRENVYVICLRRVLQILHDLHQH